MTAQKTAAAPQTKPEAVPAKPATKPHGQVQHTVTPTKDAPVATDNSKLSFSDLQKRLEELKKEEEQIAALIAEKRGEEIKVLADGYAKKCAAAGFTPQEAVDALMAYLPAKASKGKGAKGPKAAKAPKQDTDSTGGHAEEGKSYKLPDGTIYVRKGKGRVAGAAIAAVKAGKTWAEMLLK